MNPMAKAKLIKVVINACREDFKEKELMNQVMNDFMIITGQKPIKTRAKKSIANFKIREGQELGVKVTLRSRKMKDFVGRLVNAVLPRVRDFQGLDAKSFDGSGNLTIGIKEHTVFPEINPEKSPQPFSLEVVLVTSAKNDKEGIDLLRKEWGFPIKD